VDGALGDGVGEVARGGLGVVENLCKGFAQGRYGALQIHRFGGGGDDEGGTRARRTGGGEGFGSGTRAKSCMYIPGRWALLIGGPELSRPKLLFLLGQKTAQPLDRFFANFSPF
jgi:hypothetical protein